MLNGYYKYFSSYVSGEISTRARCQEKTSGDSKFARPSEGRRGNYCSFLFFHLDLKKKAFIWIFKKSFHMDLKKNLRHSSGSEKKDHDVKNFLTMVESICMVLNNGIK